MVEALNSGDISLSCFGSILVVGDVRVVVAFKFDFDLMWIGDAAPLTTTVAEVYLGAIKLILLFTINLAVGAAATSLTV